MANDVLFQYTPFVTSACEIQIFHQGLNFEVPIKAQFKINESCIAAKRYESNQYVFPI